MSYTFTISPDFSPDHISGWYIFNTWLQKQSGESVHLEMYNNFQEQREAIEADKIDIIYANPFDAAMLVREKGFLPLVKPEGISDEAIIAVRADSGVEDIAQLSAGINVAVTEDPDVHLMGMIMLEVADLDKSNINILTYDTYVLIAKSLLTRKADVGFFLAEAYDDLSSITRNQLKILVRSQISVIHHSLMIGPSLANRRLDIQNMLLSMIEDEKGKNVLENLKFNSWVKVEDDEMEFMIDLMDTLFI